MNLKEQTTKQKNVIIDGKLNLIVGEKESVHNHIRSKPVFPFPSSTCSKLFS